MPTTLFSPTNPDRRLLLKCALSAAGGMMIAFPLSAGAAQLASVQDHDNAGELGAFLVIEPDNSIVVRVPQSEMGQGTATGLAMLLAEELACDWSSVSFEHASSNRNLRENRVYGGMQTVGSGGLRGSVRMMLTAGANARELLRLAAATTWNVPVTECTVEAGQCRHAASGRAASFGALAPVAAKLTLAAPPALKAPDQYKLAGKWTKRLDTAVKLDGSAQFGIDAKVPGMVYAAVSGCPVAGGTLKSVDESAIAGRRGILRVVKLKDAVAVVADRFWRAKTAVDLLKPQWEVGDAGKVQGAQLNQDMLDALKGEMAEYGRGGDIEAAFAVPGVKLVEAVYEAPFLSHAPMEPPNVTVHLAPDRVDIWVGTQNPMAVIDAAAKATGVDPKNVYVHNAYLGGGFGRRYLTDEIVQGIEIAKAVGKPVKLIWTREQDILRGPYRPQAAVRFKGALDAQGKGTALQVRVAASSILAGQSFGGGPQGGAPFRLPKNIDPTIMAVMQSSAYKFPNRLMQGAVKNSHVPVSYWRSVGASQNGFFFESFIDELAHGAGQDPYKFRRAMLDKPDWLAVLDTMAQKSGWDKPLPPGQGRGMAIVGEFGSVCGEVVEVTVNAAGKLTVDRVIVVIDPRNVANPNTVTQQMESCVIFGLTAALYGEITIKDGAAVETNFNRYRMVRLADAPRKIEVHLVPSGGASWGGVGEAGLPPLAPALCNAIFAATGKRIRRLPLMKADLRKI